jgi:hypothetical protein
MSRRQHVADDRLRAERLRLNLSSWQSCLRAPEFFRRPPAPPNPFSTREITTMLSLAQSLFLDSELRVEQELPHVGSVLENPFVFDAVAREFEQMAERGLVEIVQAHKSNHAEPLIDSLRYRRVRIG